MISLLAASVLLGNEAMATQVNVTTANPVVDLVISEMVEARPDIATFATGVQNLAPTATEAVRANNTQMGAVITRLRKLGIAETDIQTTQLSLEQRFDYSGGPQIFKGYIASNTVNAKLRDLTKLSLFLDALASDGATSFNGPVFGIDDDSIFRDAARDKVWAAAMNRARNIARKAGYADVRVLRVEETDQGQGYLPMPAMAHSMDASQKSTPISPGQLNIGATLSFTFEMIK